MREKLREDMKAAMKAKETRRLSTIRLMLAAIQERDNAAPNGKIPDEEILPVLNKMIRQRKESLETYEKAGRGDLAKVEREEIAIIEGYLPKQMSEAEAREAIAALVKEVGASGPKDMGKVMGALKAKFSGQMDMGKANGVVKELLTK
ncbi:MAG: GatB/YqeY domain-containing protein [Alphaproteobacteria bacterium]